eukprot:Blabericola_migrator_1__11439@NODE_67_length_15652_cov_76_134937_g60_i0_p4_GENE_NODE_67_length_15652_cov_76_134937_g60_i0NODE_67_length_15652_cov_76_134937_g60_i0_p4_ORF_typecomplete_len541_score80_89DDOST_48kD/PF03345_14/0_65DDOST_48kD/PF03345_14/1_2e28_NODE_67_length_15652_cov_76_134937_g60_i062107832
MRRWAVLLCPVVVWSLHADDQVRINDVTENPVDPAVNFLYALEQPETLVVADTAQLLDKHEGLVTYLTDSGHKVVTAVQNNSVPIRATDGSSRWLYDTIILLGSNLPKASVRGKDSAVLTDETLLELIDTRWLLPRPAEHQEGDSSLPPSVMVFVGGNCNCEDDEGSCGSQLTPGMKTFLKGVGFLPLDKGEKSCVNATLTTSSATEVLSHPVDLAYQGGSHMYYPSNDLITPILLGPLHSKITVRKPGYLSQMNFTESMLNATREQGPQPSLISVFQGPRSWSRVFYASSSALCAEADKDRSCQEMIDWATHRRGVVTWSNLRHWRLEDGYEWSEYKGLPARESWSDEELRDLKMSRPYLYRIRDEILVAVDLWHIRPRQKVVSEDAPKFEWAPFNHEPWVKLEYDMMETYIRKLMLPASANIEQQTALMKAVQANNFRPVGQLTFNDATHWTHYKAPKQHGIFKLVLKSVGHKDRSPVWVESLMPLRTYKHDEDPRFVPTGAPFYAAMLVCSIVFTSALLLFPLLPPVSQDSHHSKEE